MIKDESSQIELSVIIVNFRTLNLTTDCVKSVQAALQDKLQYEIIIVDNFSEDDSFIHLCELECEEIHVIETERNGGFGYGNNRGVEIAKGKYLFFLNSDTILFPEVLPNMIQKMRSDQTIGIMSCGMVDGDKHSLIVAHSFETQKSLFIQTIIKPLTPRILQKIYRRKVAETSGLYEADWVSGAALLISSDVFTKAGGWNEKYFMYMEDEELCYRVKEMGMKVVLYPDIGLIHLVGSSGGSAFSAYQRYKSKLIYYSFVYKKDRFLIRILLYIQAWSYMKRVSIKDKLEVIRKLKETNSD